MPKGSFRARPVRETWRENWKDIRLGAAITAVQKEPGHQRTLQELAEVSACRARRLPGNPRTPWQSCPWSVRPP